MKLTVTGDDFPTHARILRQEVEERTKNIDGEMAVSLRVTPCGKDGDGYCIAGQDPDTAAFTRAAAIAAAQNKRILPAEAAGWRWRILYIRALLDRKRYTYYEAHKAEMNLTPRDLRHTAGDMLKDDAEAQALLWELCVFYHCAADNGENGWTHPPVAGADPR